MNINKYKKIISIAMLMVIMATTFSMNAFAVDEPLTVSDGKNFEIEGENLTVLKTYSGTGPISPKYSDNIKNVQINPGVRRLVGTFQSYYNLTSVRIPSTVQTIGEDAFADCFDLQSITIPNSVTEIGDRAFMGCTNLTSITIPSSVNKIGQRAFSGCTKLKSITIPGSVNTIDDYTFSGCTNLSSVDIEDNVDEIKAYAFSGCINLKEVNIPDSIEEIGDYAFGQCKKLKEVKILNSETKISKHSFPKSTNVIHVDQPQPTPAPNPTPKPVVVIDYITPPVSTPIISPNYNVCTEGMCGKNVNFIFDKSTGNLNISGIGEIEYSPWFDYSSEIKSISINEGVRKTGDNTFANLTNLEEVSLPNKSLIEIGKSAFEGCKNLKKIFIPDSVEKIGDYAFNGCKELNDISYKNSTYLGDYAFNECGQKKVTLRK